MSRIKTGLLATTLAAIACSAAPAHADDFFDEIRLGILEHDTDLVGNSKEDGIDVGLEVISNPMTSLSAIGSPRLVIGALVNNEGYTNQAYVGIMSRWEFAQDVFRADDAFFLEGMVSVAYQDGKLDVTGTPEEAEWKSHGSHWGFRTGFGVGYRVDETWTVALSFNHFSNADLADPNEGTNDVGVRIGMGF